MTITPASISGFITAISENPQDTTPRLVLADWFDEHHDPAGTGLRIAIDRNWVPAPMDQTYLTKPSYFWSPRWREGTRHPHHLPDWIYSLIAPRNIEIGCKTQRTAGLAWLAYIDAWRLATKYKRWPRPIKKKPKPHPLWLPRHIDTWY